MKKATATPAPAARQPHHPHRASVNLGDLFKPKTSGAAASPAAAVPAPAKGTSTQAATKAPAPGGGHGKVWVNTENACLPQGRLAFLRHYKKGKYMTEAEAIKEGNKAEPSSINSAENRLWLRYFAPHRPMSRRW